MYLEAKAKEDGNLGRLKSGTSGNYYLASSSCTVESGRRLSGFLQDHFMHWFPNSGVRGRVKRAFLGTQAISSGRGHGTNRAEGNFLPWN